MALAAHLNFAPTVALAAGVDAGAVAHRFEQCGAGLAAGGSCAAHGRSGCDGGGVGLDFVRQWFFAAGASMMNSAMIFKQYYALAKPRVIQLIVFCALIGMVLAVPGVPNLAQLRLAALACLGIWLVAGAAAAFNCLVEKGID